ncbi:MAG: PEP-CTERM sorting domain-containing protein [Pirellulales bacterium]|nr:PEP-CTERM sorting domain-containing protein [Pirellulales bacterium]
MRAIAFALMAVLAMSTVASAQVTVGTTQNLDPGAGLRSYTVQATGVGIGVLAEFAVTGSVNQVWTAAGVQSEWLNGAATPNNPLDSFVIFGDDRAPDLLNNPPDPDPDPPLPAAVTLETITGGGTSGLGTLNNSSAGSYDGYFKEGALSTTSQVEDLLQLIVPDGKLAIVELTVVTGEYGTTTSTRHEFWGTGNAIQIKSPYDGDANLDGTVNLGDLGVVAMNWEKTGMTWGQGDFNSDGTVNLGDLGVLAMNWGKIAEWAGGGAALAAIPEPGTIAMLVMGALCLVGYRLRRK